MTLETQPPHGEPADIRCIMRAFRDMQIADNLGKLPVLRAEHAKAHGTVCAHFMVPPNLPDDLRHGVFARAGTYRAFIRFSASSHVPRSDTRRDLHGMAIKVLDVRDGNRETVTQDFVLTSYPAFPTRDAADYCPLANVLIAPKKKIRDIWAVVAHPCRFGRDLALGARIKYLEGGISNPLTTRYWSQTPYKLGSVQYVKYSARPHPQRSLVRRTHARVRAGTRNIATMAIHDPSRYDFLADAMASQLSGSDGGAWFEFQVQLGVDGMPVDDPRVRWDERLSPFRTVAIIWIPPQDFRSQARRNFGETLSFSPGNALPAHEPVGSINRVRVAVYEASSRRRHEINQVSLREPTASDCWLGEDTAG
jgi:hypothetical protein